MDLIEGSRSHISQIKSKFSTLDDLCCEGSGLLSKHPKIKKINIARRNTRDAIEQVNFYRQIPDQVCQLKYVLARDTSKLKSIHDEVAKLKKWRDLVLFEIRQSLERTRRMSHKQDFDTSEDSYGSIDAQNRMLDVIGNYTGDVATLEQLVRDTLWATIGKCLHLAEEEPSQLVSALQIIEATDREQKDAFAKMEVQMQAKEEAEMAGQDYGPIEFVHVEDLRDECQRVLLRMIEERVNTMPLWVATPSPVNPSKKVTDQGGEKREEDSADEKEVSKWLIGKGID